MRLPGFMVWEFEIQPARFARVLGTEAAPTGRPALPDALALGAVLLDEAQDLLRHRLPQSGVEGLA